MAGCIAAGLFIVGIPRIMVTYRTLCQLTSLITFVLFLTLLLYPFPMFRLFGVEMNPPAEFFARRAAILFLLPTALVWQAQAWSASAARAVVNVAMVLSLAGLALLGVVELWRGFAGPGIWLAIASESALALAYGYFWRQDRRQG